MATLKCYKCGETKSLADGFYSSGGRIYSPCKKCRIAASREYTKRRPDVARKAALKWKAVHPDGWKKTYEKRKNKESYREQKRLASARFRAKLSALGLPYPYDPAKVLANVRLYQARKRHALPAWANRFFMAEAYDLAALRTASSGIAWHVDHIVPIRGNRVSGLHCEFNLRVIPAVENLRKGNRHAI